MASIREQAREVAEAARAQARSPGADAAWRQGRRRRARTVTGGVLLLALTLAGAAAVVRRAPLTGGEARPVATAGRSQTPAAASRGLGCPPASVAAGAVACGESQGVSWEYRLKQHQREQQGSETRFRTALDLWVAGRRVGQLRGELPYGWRAFGTPFQVRGVAVRPLMSMAGFGRESGTAWVRTHYGDAYRDSGAVDAAAVRVSSLDAWVAAAFIPAGAFIGRAEGFDPEGSPSQLELFDAWTSCEAEAPQRSASRPPLRPCSTLLPPATAGG
ncbi:MAG TPA: hypothetical protein VKG45_06395 [Actinomycetes bacterium]|nr:hypothetical protein [Actinomycetes bacterium]